MWENDDFDDLPIELRTIIANDTIGSLPFSEDEIMEVLENKDRLLLYNYLEGKSYIYCPSKKMNNRYGVYKGYSFGIIDDIITINKHPHHNKSPGTAIFYCGYNDIIKYTSDMFNIRYDSGCDKSVMLLDLVTIHSIMEKRFIKLNPKTAAIEALKYTKAYFESVVEYLRSKNVLPLFIYLLSIIELYNSILYYSINNTLFPYGVNTVYLKTDESSSQLDIKICDKMYSCIIKSFDQIKY